MKSLKVFGTAALLAMTVSVTVSAQPGITRPIRIGMFKGTGSTGGTYWHDNIHTAVAALTSMLANPAAAGLGDSLVIPPAGFTFMNSGVAQNTAGTAECTGSACGPTPAQISGFITAMDTLDVMFISCFVDFGSRVSNATQRQSFADFWTTKGYVAVHASTDSKSRWAPLDTIHGAVFRNHPQGDRGGRLVRDSVFEAEASFKYLNKGLFVNNMDTSFTEEWFFFNQTGAAIRNVPFLKPTVKLDEPSLVGGLGGQTAMGDHPMSWYRQLPTGGRFFYTAVGHRPNNWQGGSQPRFLRRQLYNAFLWAAKYDSTSSTAIMNWKTSKAPGDAFNYAKLSVSPSELNVTVMQTGKHAVELVGIDGKRIASRRGEGLDKSYAFTNLRAGVYAVVVFTAQGRSDRLVTVP